MSRPGAQGDFTCPSCNSPDFFGRERVDSYEGEVAWLKINQVCNTCGYRRCLLYTTRAEYESNIQK